MRTTLRVKDDVFKELLKVTGAKTKTEAVHEAIREYLRRKKLDELISMSGKVRVDYDWKAMREFEVRERIRRWRKSS